MGVCAPMLLTARHWDLRAAGAMRLESSSAALFFNMKIAAFGKTRYDIRCQFGGHACEEFLFTRRRREIFIKTRLRYYFFTVTLIVCDFLLCFCFLGFRDQSHNYIIHTHLVSRRTISLIFNKHKFWKSRIISINL